MNKQYCCAMISRGYHYVQCSRKVKVTVNGKGYCTQHSPEARAERDSKRDVKFKQKQKQRNAPYEKIKELETVIRHCKHALDNVANEKTLHGNVVDSMASVRRVLKLIENQVG